MPRSIWFVVYAQAIVVLLLVSSVIATALIKDFGIGHAMLLVVGLGFTALPLQLMVMFYGTCMAIVEARSVVMRKRKWFLMIALSPWAFVVVILGGGVLLDFLL